MSSVEKIMKFKTVIYSEDAVAEVSKEKLSLMIAGATICDSVENFQELRALVRAVDQALDDLQDNQHG